MEPLDGQEIRRRRVFYIPGYDPIHPRRYRELYRKEGAAQAAISGYEIGLKPKATGGRYGWHVTGSMDGADVEADVEVLVWSDIVRDSMSTTIPATYLQLVRTAWEYIATGALRRLMRLRKGPVIAALYFVLVVIASSGLFLTLHAEFMAFALVIVYAGAILITYLFVLMLAQQSPTDGTDSGSSWYDRTPREPAIALLACFILLSSLVQVMTDTEAQDFAQQTATKAEQSQQLAWKDLERMPRQLERVAREAEPGTAAVNGGITFDGALAQVEVTLADGGTRTVTLPVESMPTNTQIIGLALVADFPVSLELAGVILLMAMFGAVVLARRQIELGEDEIRESAGMAPEVERGGDE